MDTRTSLKQIWLTSLSLEILLGLWFGLWWWWWTLMDGRIPFCRVSVLVLLWFRLWLSSPSVSSSSIISINCWHVERKGLRVVREPLYLQRFLCIRQNWLSYSNWFQQMTSNSFALVFNSSLFKNLQLLLAILDQTAYEDNSHIFKVPDLCDN